MGYTIHVQFIPPDKLIFQKLQERDAVRMKRLLARKGIDSEIVRFPAQSRVHLKVRLPVSDEGWSAYASMKISDGESSLSLEFPSLRNRLTSILERAWKAVGINTATRQISEFKKSLRIIFSKE